MKRFNREEIKVGAFYITLAIFIVVFWIGVYSCTNAVASLVTRPDGSIDRKIQNYDNRSVLKYGRGWKVVVYHENCSPDPSRSWSCAYRDGRIYINPPSSSSDFYFKMIYYHEKAHIWDSWTDTKESHMVRGGFVKHMRYDPNIPWTHAYKNNDKFGPDFPVSYSELFADAVAYCSYIPKRHWGYDRYIMRGIGYGWYPTRQQARRVCSMLAKYMR